MRGRDHRGRGSVPHPGQHQTGGVAAQLAVRLHREGSLGQPDHPRPQHRATVDEHNDYDTLVPGGSIRPDGTTEWQDLGSMASCPMVYMAQAISTEGLSHPVPDLPMPGAVETSALQALFDFLGLPLTAPPMTCRSIDDAFVGLTWKEIIDLEIFGIPWYEVAEFISTIFPDLLHELLGSTQDDFGELVLGAVGLCAYAQVVDDDALYREARRTLDNLVQMTRLLTGLVYGMAKEKDMSQTIIDRRGMAAYEFTLESTDELTYRAALYARMFDIDAPLEDFDDFSLGDQRTWWIESQQYHADTTEAALLSDQEIETRIFNALPNKEPWIQDRYTDRFGSTVPVRRAGDGYECIGPDDQWMPTENKRHFWFGSINLWWEAHLCTIDPHTLDCEWARLGCAPADLDGSETVDAADQALFDAAWTTYGDGASCSAGNGWCDGADLDQSGVLDAEDGDYMDAAQGCTT